MPEGYLKPVYSQFNPEVGHWVHAYDRKDFDKIVAGYACGQCGEDYMGEFHIACPVCGFLAPAAHDRGGDMDMDFWRHR